MSLDLERRPGGVPADPVAVVPSAVDMAPLSGLVPGSVNPPRDGSPEVDPGDAATLALLADLAGRPDDETPLVAAWQDPAGEATEPFQDRPAIATTGTPIHSASYVVRHPE